MPETTIEQRNCAHCEVTCNIYDMPYATNFGRICENCSNEHFFVCDRCNNRYSNDDYETDGLCQRCANHVNNVIHDCGYFPRTAIEKYLEGAGKMAWENTLFQGVELEVEVNEYADTSTHANRFKEYLEKEGMGDFLYFKEDGSLENGYEIVSKPLTPLARHARMNWYKALEWLKKNKTKAWRTDTCGLHIHVSLAALSKSDVLKLKLFFANFRGAIQRIAGRKGNQYCEYENFSLGDYFSGMRKRYAEASESRYVAVNLNRDKGTVEFRVFKATLNYGRFLGCLQFTEAVCEFVKEHSAIRISRLDGWNTFKEWVLHSKKARWKHLEKHIRKVGA